MNIKILKDSNELGLTAAKHIAALLNESIKENGKANLLLSTGKSQFDTIKALTKQDVPWEKVTMYHLDEYVGLSKSHPASFRKYLEDRFVSKVHVGNAVFVDGEGDAEAKLVELNKTMESVCMDVGVVGIGENAHIAFNDPPADFKIDSAYKIVNLDDKCKMQQVHEGWFENISSVPKKAISMTVSQIMRCKHIISPVPFSVKATAIRDALLSDISPLVPASKLREHADWTLYIDQDSASKIQIIGGKVYEK